MNKWTALTLATLVLALIGCGGSGDGFGDTGLTSGSTATTATSGGATNGGTGGEVSRFAGEYQGSFSGSNTSGARFDGAGAASISASGGATFAFQANIGGAPYVREFTGTLNGAGEFAGVTHTGEPATGSFTLDGTTLRGTIVWQKRTVDGDVFYTETEQFELLRR